MYICICQYVIYDADDGSQNVRHIDVKPTKTRGDAWKLKVAKTFPRPNCQCRRRQFKFSPPRIASHAIDKHVKIVILNCVVPSRRWLEYLSAKHKSRIIITKKVFPGLPCWVKSCVWNLASRAISRMSRRVCCSIFVFWWANFLILCHKESDRSGSTIPSFRRRITTRPSRGEMSLLVWVLIFEWRPRHVCRPQIDTDANKQSYKPRRSRRLSPPSRLCIIAAQTWIKIISQFFWAESSSQLQFRLLSSSHSVAKYVNNKNNHLGGGKSNSAAQPTNQIAIHKSTRKRAKHVQNSCLLLRSIEIELIWGWLMDRKINCWSWSFNSSEG